MQTSSILNMLNTISNKVSKHTIELNGQPVEYWLRQSSSARKIRVRIGPGGFTVTQPADRKIEEVETFLNEHRVWITNQLARMSTFQQLRRPQVSVQKEMLFCGEQTTLRIEESHTLRGPARIQHDENGITLIRSVHSSVPASKSLENWLRKQATKTISAELVLMTQKLNRTPNRVYIMDQRTKWGNCSALGNLSFNWRLILAPPYVLRYLVAHEAVHLVVPDHSRRFWLMLQSLCPETERARQWLAANSERLFLPLPTQTSSI